MERFAPAADLERRTAPGGSNRWRQFAMVTSAVGILIRVVLASTTVGSNDVITWERFARAISDSGLLHMYAIPLVAGWNHPPLAGLLAGAALDVSEMVPIPFRVAFKLPMVASDAGVLFLLWRFLSPRAEWLAASSVAVFALSPDAILVSAYHGNTDPLVGVFILASAVAGLSGRSLLAGVALGGAINIKLVPIILVPVLLAHQRTIRDLLRTVSGLAMASLPFLPVLATNLKGFLAGVAGYMPKSDNWGVSFILRMLDGSARSDAAGPWSYPWLEIAGRCLIFGIPALLSWLYVRRGWQNLTAAYALSVALFLVVTPGFGVQYTAMLGPILTAYSWKWGAIWGVLSGVFLGLVYWHFWTGNFPPSSLFESSLPVGPAWVGLAAWACLLALLVTNYRAVATEVREVL